MRLIYAEDIKKRADCYLPSVRSVVANILSHTKTVKDAVLVVRCKDCKYASPNGEYGCKAYHFKLYETHEMKADDFCSHGERREDG